MDFWEVLKVVVRRWVVTVPLVVLAITTAVLLPPRIDPTYTALSSTAVISPSGADPGANPFVALGAVSMAQGLSLSADSPAAVQQVQDLGGSGSYTVAMQNSRTPILNVRTDAATPESAVRTSELVLDLIRRQLEDRQSAIGAPPATQYTVENLISDPVPVPVYDARQQARFLALGLGLVLAVALAMAVEGVAVVRARRRGADDTSDTLALVERRLELLEERERLLVERERLLGEQTREAGGRRRVTRRRAARHAEADDAEASPERAADAVDEAAATETEDETSPAAGADDRTPVPSRPAE